MASGQLGSSGCQLQRLSSLLQRVAIPSRGSNSVAPPFEGEGVHVLKEERESHHPRNKVCRETEELRWERRQAA